MRKTIFPFIIFCFYLQVYGSKLCFNDAFQIIEKIKLSQEKELISAISDFKVDNEGNLWIADNKSYRIRKYNQKGKLILSFGRRGQGPGEFIRIQSFVFDKKRNIIYLISSNRINIFNKKGKFLKSFPSRLIKSFKFLSDGSIIANEIEITEENKWYFLKKLNSNFKPIKSFYPAHPLVYTHQFILAHAYFDIDLKDNIYAIQSEDYTIYKFDSNGKLIKKFSKKGKYYIPPPFDFKVNKMDRRQMNKWLNSFSKITNLFTLKKKRLILVEFLNNVEKKEYFIDIYDVDGNFIKGSIKTNLPLLGVDEKQNIYFLDEKLNEKFDIDYFIVKCILTTKYNK